MSAQRITYSLHLYFMVVHINTFFTNHIALSAFLDPSFYYSDGIKSAMTSQITNFGIVYSTVYCGADKK